MESLGAAGSAHSHGGHSHTIKHQNRLTRMVATDSNENDERVTSPDNAPEPPRPQPKKHGHGHGHGHSHSSASQVRYKHFSSLIRIRRIEFKTWAVERWTLRFLNLFFQMNMRGVFLHVIADALGSVIVIISASIIWLWDWEYENYVDPMLSVFMVILLLHSVWPLCKSVSTFEFP